jgi:hypothetical protein
MAMHGPIVTTGSGVFKGVQPAARRAKPTSIKMAQNDQTAHDKNITMQKIGILDSRNVWCCGFDGKPRSSVCSLPSSSSRMLGNEQEGYEHETTSVNPTEHPFLIDPRLSERQLLHCSRFLDHSSLSACALCDDQRSHDF